MAVIYWVGPQNGLSSDVNFATASGGAATETLTASDTAIYDSGGTNDCTWNSDLSNNITLSSTYGGIVTLTQDTHFDNATVDTGATLDQGPYNLYFSNLLNFLGTLVSSSSSGRIYYTGGDITLKAEALDIPYGYEIHLQTPCTHESSFTDPTLPMTVIDMGTGNNVTLTDAVSNSPGIGPIRVVSGGFDSPESEIYIGGRFAQSWIGTAPYEYPVIDMAGGDSGDTTSRKFYGHTGHTMTVTSGGHTFPRSEWFINDIGGSKARWLTVGDYSSAAVWKLQDPSTWECGGNMAVGITGFGGVNPSPEDTYEVLLNGFVWNGSSWFASTLNMRLEWDMGTDGEMRANDRFIDDNQIPVSIDWRGTGEINITNPKQNVNLGLDYMPYTVTISGTMSTDKTFGTWNVRRLIIDGSSFVGNLYLDAAKTYHADHLQCDGFFMLGTNDPTGPVTNITISQYAYPLWTDMLVGTINCTQGVIYCNDGTCTEEALINHPTVGDPNGFEFDLAAQYPPPSVGTTNGYSEYTHGLGVGLSLGLGSGMNASGRRWIPVAMLPMLMTLPLGIG